MNDQVRIVRFNIFDRLFHVFIMVTFLIQAVTGMGRLLYTTTGAKASSACSAAMAAPPGSTIPWAS